MPALTISNNQLQINEIRDLTHQARQQAYPIKSGYMVGVVLEVRFQEHYYYFGGANIEFPHHNILTLHAEKSALSLMVTSLGNQVKINRAFFLGAPQGQEQNNEFKDMFVWPCGQCRQVLREFCLRETEFISLTISGKVSQATTIAYLLPNQFDNDNLQAPSELIKQNQISNDHGLTNTDYFTKAVAIPEEQILPTLQRLKAHILNPNFSSNHHPVVLVTTTNGITIPGVEIQNPAFLDCDAIFSAIANGICHLGHQNFKLARIDMYSDQKEISNPQELLSMTEIEALKHFHSDVLVSSYNPNSGQSFSETLFKNTFSHREYSSLS